MILALIVRECQFGGFIVMHAFDADPQLSLQALPEGKHLSQLIE